MSDANINLEAEFTLLRGQFIGLRKRASTRYRCKLTAMGYLTGGADGIRHEVWLLNASEVGIGFMMSRSLDAGSDVAITFASPQIGHFTLPARVVHSTKGNKDQWLIGCEFAQRLTVDMLDELL